MVQGLRSASVGAKPRSTGPRAPHLLQLEYNKSDKGFNPSSIAFLFLNFYKIPQIVDSKNIVMIYDKIIYFTREGRGIMKQKTGYFLLVALLTLVLIGCGNNSDRKDNGTSTQSTENIQKNEQESEVSSEIIISTETESEIETQADSKNELLSSEKDEEVTGENSESGINTEETEKEESSETENVFEEEQMQKLIEYNKAVDLINSLTGDYTNEQFEIMETAYNILVNLGDYKDAPEILSHFTEFTKQFNSNNDTYSILNNKNQVVFEAQTRMDLDNKFFTYYFYVLNEKGLLSKTERTEYLVSGKENSSYYIYEYNDSNELVAEYRYGQGDSLMQTINYTDYVYNSMGLIVNKKEMFNGVERKYTYVYNAQGNLTEGIVEQSNMGTAYYSYDANGRLVSEKFESVNNPEWNNTTVYTYELCHLYKISE